MTRAALAQPPIRVPMAQANQDTQRKIDAQIANLERELLELKRQRNELSPVSTLPPEIFCSILLLATTHACDNDFTELPEKLRVNGFIGTLCHVSHLWRSTALDCSQLWAGIDVGMATDLRLVDFMVQHAQLYPISLLFKANSSKLEALDAVKRVLSGGASFNIIAVSGSLDILNSILCEAQPKSLRALQISVSDTGSLGHTATGISIAKNPLFTRGTPRLRHLSIEGCAIPLTSPILIQSLHLTSLSLPIQQGGNLSHIVDILNRMPLLQRLSFDFLGPLQLLQGSVDPVLLPSLSMVILKGDSLSVTTILSHLRLSVMHLHLNISCHLHSGSANPQHEGINLLKAIRKARCHPVSVSPTSPHNLLFLPNVISFSREPSLVGIDAVSRMMLSNWMPSDDEPEKWHKKPLKWTPIPWTQWNPLAVSHHPKDLRQLCGWSMDELRWIMVFDNEDHPDSLWRFLSQCPNISDISLSIRQVSQLLGPTLEHGVLPFPSLRRLVMGRAPVTSSADGERSLETEYKVLFESFLEGLKQRQNILSKHGVKREWVLDRLTLKSYPPEVPIQRFAQFARDHGLIGEITH
ncbi:hypothetical protein NMY22_g12491 [Coprinellus aureogranulatus]|nr:hypothetical protein NMY22_g12491 [Coprinellus aureogranulatus]